MKLFYYICFLMLPAVSYSQHRYPFSVAEKSFAALKYADAIFYYNKVLRKDSLNKEAVIHLAESYYKTQQYAPALRFYEKSLQLPSPDNTSYYRYGQLLAMQGRYRESAAAYRAYLGKGLGDENLRKTALLYEQGVNALYRDTASVHLALLNINSAYADFSPVFHLHGLLFVSDRPLPKVFKRTNGWNGGNFLQVYRMADTALIKGASLRTPSLEAMLSYAPGNVRNNDNNRLSSNDSKIIGADPQFNFVEAPNQLSVKTVALYDSRLTNKYHTGPVAFNTRMDTLFLTRNQRMANGKSINRLGLDILVARHDGWELQHDFPFNSEAYSIGQPAPHPDGHVLFFTSDMPGGFGGKDIYYSVRTDSGWGKPVNAGPFVNTPGDEMFPYVAASGQLYFSSDNWPGLGGLDIFSVKLDDHYQPVAAPQNAGAPLNSSHNDFGILLYKNGSRGFISSDRRGNDDIYGFSR